METVMTWEVRVGHALDLLRAMPSDSVQMCFTSPPYWGLRNYGTNPQVWGGDPACEHLNWEEVHPAGWRKNDDCPGALQGQGNKNRQELQSWTCGCGAWKGELGMEHTPELFIEHLVLIFHEVYRVLKSDGTLWVNIGDSYNGSGGAGGDYGKGGRREGQPKFAGRNVSSLKPKDLVGIPWRLAFGLQADGWYLRQENIWHKPRPMPESVADRTTRSHEHVFHLAKAAEADHEQVFHLSKSRQYFYDAKASAEASVSDHPSGNCFKRPERLTLGGRGQDKQWTPTATRNRRTVWTVNTKPSKVRHFACVDRETECLTINGWKKYNEVSVGDLAAQFNMETSVLSWGEVNAVATYEVVDQDMVVIGTKRLDLMLTPNHRTIVCNYTDGRLTVGPYRFVRADAVKSSHAIPGAASWVDCGDEVVDPDLAELIGWYVAEGHELRHGSSVEIYQSYSANNHKVCEIRELLKKTEAAFVEIQSSRVVNGKPHVMAAFKVSGYVALVLRKLCPGASSLPPDILSWSTPLLRRLFKGLIDGDGHKRKDGRMTFIQNQGPLVDMVQAIGVRLGYSTTKSYRYPSKPQHSGTEVIYFTNRYWSGLKGTAGTGKSVRREIVKYSGIVWCPSLSDGTWVARRNGRVFITGNTMPVELAEIPILAGSRPGDTVLDPFNGAGTTGVAALMHERRYIGLELNPQYAQIARDRLDRPFDMVEEDGVPA